MVSYKYVEFSYGVASTENWMTVLFFDVVQLFDVYEHIETPDPVSCTDTCQVLFPNCDSVSIKKDRYDDIYQCHGFLERYYPIDYEDRVKGRISIINIRVRNQTYVHLCYTIKYPSTLMFKKSI